MKPVYIDGCYAVLHPANGQRGVVICGSLGDESLNSYRAQVFLAEQFAEAGFPTLRIHYYGTGDSAGADDEPGRFQAWINSITKAVQWLRATHSVTSVTLCGLRIGATLAACAAANEPDSVDALILLAPVASGRRFLREQTLTARTVADIWQSRATIDDGQWFEAYGLRLDRETRDALDALDIGKLHLPGVQRILVLDQPGAPASHRLVDRLGAQNIATTHEIGDGLDRLLADSHEAEVPHTTFARAVAWLGDAGKSNQSAVDLMTQSLSCATFEEKPVRLGPDDSLAGILTMPRQDDKAVPVVLIPSTGANPRFGTSRSTVILARWLAEQGISSLRIDGHGIGDAALSTGELGLPYSQQGNQDVSAGVDFLAQHFTAPIMVLGMCSGAYHAFQAAWTDARISALILVNLQKFVWQGGESLSVVQRTTLRTTSFYLRNLPNPATWRRLVRGQINVIGITRALAHRGVRQLVAAADPAIAAVSGETQVGTVRRQLSELSNRGVQILYVLSGNDPGLDEIGEYFGFRGWRLRRNPCVMFRSMDGADHTLSAHWARRTLQEVIAVFLRQRFGIEAATGTAEAPASRGQHTVLSRLLPKKAGMTIDSAPTAA